MEVRHDNFNCEDYCQAGKGDFAGRRKRKDCKDCPRTGEGVFNVYTHVSVNNPAEITFVEKYADQDAFDAHGQTPYFKQFRETTKELAAEWFTIQFLTELG